RDLGAKAVLIVVPKNSDMQPRSPFEFANASSAEIPVLRVAYPMAEAWLQAAGKSLETLTADASAAKPVSFATGVKIRLAADVKKDIRVTANIVGLIEGSDPVLKSEY